MRIFNQSTIIRKLFCSILLASLFFSNNVVFAESTSDLKQQINNNVAAQTTAKDEIATLDSQINTILAQIDTLDAKIASNKDQIATAEAELAKQDGFLEEYLKTMYIDGQTSTIELIVTSSNFSDFVDKSQYLSTMQQNVQDTANKIAATKTELEKQKKELEISQQQQISLKAGLQQQRAQKDSYLGQLTDQEKALRDKLAQMMSNGTVSCGTRSKTGGQKFMLPLDCGFISQGYGNTEYASVEKAYGGKIHNGIDIAVGANTSIHPIGDGTVYATGESPSGGWGNWIIINHHNGFYSLYAHMISPSFYSKGDSVTTDDTLGGVGGTPWWPVHLHLSLFNGEPSGWNDGEVGPYPGNTVDPLDYMNITISTGGTDWDPTHAH
jgi:murein DD-endopeptidase MepM/ murein hydrolase activator NlpD